MEQINQAEKERNSIFELTLTGMFIALTLVFTMFINVKLPIAANGGLIHLGNAPLFVAAILIGKKTGALAGAFGMGIFDVLSGAWATWAPFTFLIVGLMGWTVGALTEKHKDFFHIGIAIIAAALIKVIGYYIAEVILYHNLITPITSIPGNLIQIGVAAVVLFIVIAPLKKVFSHFDI